MAVGVGFAGADRLLFNPIGDGEGARLTELPAMLQRGKLLTCWRLQDGEVEEVGRTRRIWLRVWGAATPLPIFVTGLEAEAANG